MNTQDRISGIMEDYHYATMDNSTLKGVETKQAMFHQEMVNMQNSSDAFKTSDDRVMSVDRVKSIVLARHTRFAEWLISEEN